VTFTPAGTATDPYRYRVPITLSNGSVARTVVPSRNTRVPGPAAEDTFTTYRTVTAAERVNDPTVEPADTAVGVPPATVVGVHVTGTAALTGEVGSTRTGMEAVDTQQVL
jgi:hypothetical protein